MVYIPAEDSYFFAHILARFVKGKVVLDMGAGSGILSEAALNARASSVCSVDIDSEAVEFLRLKRLTTIESDLFEKVSGLFDVILCNAPYLPEDSREGAEGKVAIVGGKRGDEFILRFLKQAQNHLAPDGCILLLLSSRTPRERILALLKKQKMKNEVVAEKKLFFETLEVWKINSNIVST